jgi:BMFP domain-containing protein YqiC
MVERFFEPLELVSRREFESRLDGVAELRARIADLERRLAALEASG